MKKLKILAEKIMPAFVACLTMVLAVNANSSSCFYINQPKEPESAAKFKKFK